MPYQRKMWFWNQDYFEVLKEIGGAYADQVDFEHFSAYCLLKEKGLKKDANAASVKFVEHVQGLSTARRRRISADLARLFCTRPRIHSLINYPISKFIKATLQAWVTDVPDSLDANRYYAFFGGGSAFLESALMIDPKDQISVVRLSYWLIDDVDYCVHHLDEGYFIGDEQAAAKTLDRVSQLIETVEDKQTRGYLTEEYRSYLSMLKVWSAYKASAREKSFPEWAAEQGFDFRFPEKFYYST